MRTPTRTERVQSRPLSFLFQPYVFVKETEDGYKFEIDWSDTFQYIFDPADNNTYYPYDGRTPKSIELLGEAACDWLDSLGAEELYRKLMGADTARPVFQTKPWKASP